MLNVHHFRAAHTRWHATVAVCLAACLMVAYFSVVSRRRASADDAPPLSKEEAIAEVERLGGQVRIDGEKDEQPVWAVDLKEAKIRNDDLRLLVSFPALEVLNLADTAIDDEGLTHVVVCKRLKELNLSGTKITDRGLSWLTALEGLSTLDLNRTSITDEGLLRLAALKHLSRPSIFETRTTEVGLLRLEKAIRDGIAEKKSEPPFDSAAAIRMSADLHTLGRSGLLVSDGDRQARARATELLEKALEADPDNDLVRIDLADAYVLLDEELTLAVAIDLYEDALSRKPEDDRLLVRLARAYAALENAEDAYRYVERRLRGATQPEHLHEIALQVAAIAAVTGETNLGGALLAGIVEKHPDLIGVRLVWGALLVETSPAEAKRVLQPVLERHPPPHAYGIQAQRLLSAREKSE